MLSAVKVLKPSGIFDEINSSHFRQQVNEFVQQGVNLILIDLKKVSFMDSSGLGALILILKTVKSSGGRLFLMSINDQVEMLLDLTNTKSLFEIVGSKEELKQKIAN